MTWILSQKWDCLNQIEENSKQVENFQTKLNKKIDEIFPEKTVKICDKNKPYIIKELKTLNRKIKKEWKKNGKSEKYKELSKKFKEKMKKAATEYLKKNVSDLKKINPGKAFETLERMGAHPGATEDENEFTLASHAEQNLSVEQQLDKIPAYFVSIANEYTELKIEELSEEIQRSINNVNIKEIPKIESHTEMD